MKDYKKKPLIDIKIFLRKKKKENREYDRKCYKIFSDDELQKLLKYRKNYYRMKKIALLFL